MAEVMVAREASFLNGSIDLKALHSALKKVSKEAVDALTEILKDEKIDPKVRVAAAGKLLDLNLGVAEAISKDQIQRLIGEMRKGKASGELLPDDSDRPLVDFHNVTAV